MAETRTDHSPESLSSSHLTTGKCVESSRLCAEPCHKQPSGSSPNVSFAGPCVRGGADCCHRWANTGQVNGDRSLEWGGFAGWCAVGAAEADGCCEKGLGPGDGRYENSVAVCFLVIPMIPHRDVS